MKPLVDYLTNQYAVVIRPMLQDCPTRCNAVSRNLRGIVSYARKFRPVCVITRNRDEHTRDPGGVLHVIYENGSITRANFASHSIMIDWVRNRRMFRHGVQIRHLSGNVGYLTKPGIIAGT